MPAVSDNGDRHRRTVSRIKPHFAESDAPLLQVRAIHDYQIELVLLQVGEGVGCAQRNAGCDPEALHRNSYHVRELEIAGEDKGFRRHLRPGG